MVLKAMGLRSEFRRRRGEDQRLSLGQSDIKRSGRRKGPAEEREKGQQAKEVPREPQEVRQGGGSDQQRQTLLTDQIE